MSKLEKTCKLCFHIFSKKSHCKRHMEKVHCKSLEKISEEEENSGLEIHRCKICAKEFKHGTSLKRHQKCLQELEDSFKCKYCDKVYKRKDNLQRHSQRIHNKHRINFDAAASNNDDPLKCPICSKTFEQKNKEIFFAHIASKICHDINNKLNLNENNKFECDQCEKTYLDKDTLMKHIRWKHASIKIKINCKLCTVTFSYKSTLVRHMKKIHGINDK